MRERVALYGGRFDAGRDAGGGFAVHAALPIAMTSVLIADDQALVRVGLRKILESEPDIEVVGEAGDGEDAVARRGTAAARRRADGHPHARARRDRGDQADRRRRSPTRAC